MVALSLFFLVFSCQVYGQKRTDRTNRSNRKEPDAAAAPKRTTRIVPESERVKVLTKTEFVKVAVRANKGYLSVVARTGATVRLIPLPADQKKPPSVIEKVTNEDGSLNLINLPPGEFKLVIDHPDYHSYSENIAIAPARLDTFVALNKMISLYGGIRIGGAPANARIFLDESPINLSKMIVENQNAVIPKVAVGKHRLRISKAGFADFTREIDVAPGEETFVSAQLETERVTLNLISEPGARVYVGNEEKTIVPASRNVIVSLPPGRQAIRVIKDGYQEWSKVLTLSMSNSPVNERVDLVPIPNSVEGDWQPPLGQRKWFPLTSSWKFGPSGASVKGDPVVMFDTETNREFNTYRDFRTEFDVVFSNNKGASWVVRARDPNNYYLFEISRPAGGSPVINFYICRNGKLEWKDSRPIVEKIDKPGDSFHIIFEARGNTFDTKLSIASAPSTQPYRLAIFQDDELSWGGVGFRGKDLSEFLLQTFFVIPLK